MNRIVVIDDDSAMCELVQTLLVSLEFDVTTFTRPAEGVAYIRRSPVDVVLTDVRMPGMNGIEVCRSVHEVKPALPVIVLTGFGSLESAVEAMRAGAYDFLSKPVGLDELEFSVRRACELSTLTRKLRQLRRQVRRASGLIGHSPAFERVIKQLPKAARSGVPVLVQGETGTGKEVVARALHDQSSRSTHPFVPVNCSAIPDNLAESELFGHVRGAFTDASHARAGLFAEAAQGTLFLDEVGELPMKVQPKLLRALQEHAIRPVGSDREVPVECRVIAATNVDLKAACAEGSFRSDLYFRLAVIRLAIPPLRERGGDILELAQFFVERSADRAEVTTPGLSTAAARSLLAYSWPGNVRELQNAMEHAVAMAESEELDVGDLPDEILQGSVDLSAPGLVSLAELERAHIHRVLRATDGNKKAAAEILGLDRRTLYRKLERESASE